MTQPEQGIPRNPRGWLYHVALRRLTDQVRSEMARRRREEAVAGELWAEWAFVPPLEADVSLDQDDSLALLFMCCHPSLTPPSAIALTLRAVGGLATAEIARAFLVPEATMAQRISRAKQSIRSSGIAFSLPDEVERAARLDQVLQVLYLIFNEGYTTSEGPSLHRVDLSGEAKVHGPAVGLQLLKALDRDSRIAGHHRLDAVRGHLLERAGDREAALKTSGRLPNSPPDDKTPGRCHAPPGRQSKQFLITQAASALGPRRAMSCQALTCRA